MHESEEVFKADRNASWVRSRELAESWTRAGRELAESWPRAGLFGRHTPNRWGVPRIELLDWGLLIIIQQRQIIVNISLRHYRLNSHQCIYIDLNNIVQFVQSFTIAICVLLMMSTFCVVSYYLSAKASPEWSLSLGFRTQKKLCPFNRGNRYKNYVGVFPGPNFLSPEWRCPLNIGDPKERFHCSEVREREKKKRRERGRALASYPSPSLGTI